MSKKEDKKRKIMEVTADYCLKNGYQGTSMDELTAETGVSKATIYRYFKSKECLISETLSYYSKLYTDSLIEVFNNPDLSLEQKLKARFETLHQLVTHKQFNGCNFQLAHGEYNNKDGAITSTCIQFTQDKVGLITDLLIKNDIDDAQLKAIKSELIFSGLVTTLHITKNAELIDIAQAMYLREI